MTKLKGLSTEAVQMRIQNHQANKQPKPELKTNKDIITGNIFTLFNLFNIVIAVALIAVGAYTSIFFMGVIVSNSSMFIIQEIRARNLVQNLNILVAPHVKVLRDGVIQTITPDDIVLDDVVYYEPGNQIAADSVVLEGSVETNESLLTGEVDPIDKNTDDTLLSGSFIVSGTCYAQVVHVGSDNYATKVTQQVSTQRRIASDLLNTFTSVTKLTSFFIIPIGALLFIQGFVFRHESLYQVVVNTASALLGMLPQGLVLLTTVTLMTAVLKLGKSKTLVQDLYAIEALSQIDVLCVDKTGTLTKGEMQVIDTLNLDVKFQFLMNHYVNYTHDNNATMLAIKHYFEPVETMQCIDTIPFASARKWASMTFDNQETLFIGAPEILMPNLDLPDVILNHRKLGARIILAASSYDVPADKTLPQSLHALGWIVIEDPLREDAHQAIDFFVNNGVNIKVISGDNIDTVLAIAQKAGVNTIQGAVDASTLTTPEALHEAIFKYNVIGRATPTQKLEFVKILQEGKNRVAMTGDGLNDVLALKQADVSIALGEGSDAALNISQIVIIDGMLSTLVDVVREGRQTINNITRSASLFYLRTILTISVAILAILINVRFPFIPFQVTLTNIFVGGLPSLLIMFELHDYKPKYTVLEHVVLYALPSALGIVTMWFILVLFNKPLGLDLKAIQSIVFFVNGVLSIHLIYRILTPLNRFRAFILALDIAGFLITSIVMHPLLELVSFTQHLLIILVVVVLISIPIVKLYARISKFFVTRHRLHQSA